ncbi:hypothetical protein IMY05_006G0082000 [Salix suchowensis]|nr:hypothetical protein IMY05_006G0082000 [Salix suchowensis]
MGVDKKQERVPTMTMGGRDRGEGEERSEVGGGPSAPTSSSRFKYTFVTETYAVGTRHPAPKEKKYYNQHASWSLAWTRINLMWSAVLA